MTALKISSIDSLMFRDGRPFNQADAGASIARSHFPPHPPTIVGLVRAMLWQNLGKWDKDLLGDGTNWQSDSIGQLKFSAPLVCRGKDLLFPLPLSILGKHSANGDKIDELTLLKPGTENDAMMTDLGSVRLPVKASSKPGFKNLSNIWVTSQGISQILDGKTPDAAHLVPSDELWATESRVGIGRDNDNRRTKDGQFYMASHVRPLSQTALYVAVDGMASTKQDSLGLRVFGGEHRMGFIESVDKEKMPAGQTGNNQYMAILMSPLVLKSELRPGETVAQLPGKLVSACIGKPLRIGGWDSTRTKPGPVPLRESIPAGSVLFMEGDSKKALDFHLKHIGESTPWGFGQMLIGKW